MPKLAKVKTSLAFARRLKFILFTKRSESVSANLLLTQVASCPELQAHYNLGRDRWSELFGKNPSQAIRLFLNLVDTIIAAFLPRLKREIQQPDSSQSRFIS
ncbi:unnamed protein product [Protopolystoma xenopodis]|uniref:Uncharacterized protein n=1 Tax=Protopolystoma xenopodis TaxID=117903 RepID=A0A448WHF1_9PLAT|nr:unnamed protein product [Protopolystoma xenopodis]